MDPLDTLETTRRKSGHRWLDLVVAGSAIVIAVVSLVVALRQSQIMEKQLAASTWPYLQYGSSNKDEISNASIIRLELKNAGVGPARMHELTMRYDGRPVTSGRELIDACCADIASTHGRPVWWNSTASNRVLTPNETVPFFLLTGDPANAPYFERLNATSTKIHLRACYCSVLDQCWLLDSDDVGEHQPVPSCPAARDGDYRG